MNVKIREILNRSGRAGYLRNTILTIFLSSTGYASDQDIIDDGNFLQWGLPLSAYIGTLVAEDKEGAILFTKSLATTVIATSALKDTAEKFRPRGSSTKSFPSGHTSAAFSGASFIDTRYGHEFGIPAYALAAYTGYSRIVADAHHVDDVVAGASVALFSNWFWVRPSGRFTITPTKVDGGMAVQITLSEDTGNLPPTSLKSSSYPRYRYAVEFGPAALSTNKVQSPGSSGTEFDLYNFQRRNDPTTTANANLEIYLSKKHMIGIAILPFEARDVGQFSTGVNFDGKFFPASNEIYSSYRLTDARVRYDYTLYDGLDLKLKIGAGMSYQRTVIELITADGTVSAKKKDTKLIPIINSYVSYNLSRRLKAYGDIAGITMSDRDLLHSSAGLSYELDRSWDISFGFGIYDREIITDDLKNKLRYDISYITLGYTF